MRKAWIIGWATNIENHMARRFSMFMAEGPTTVSCADSQQLPALAELGLGFEARRQAPSDRTQVRGGKGVASLAKSMGVSWEL